MKYAFFGLIIGVALTGCSGVKETIGLSRSAPDEFKVVKRAPLEMPSTYALPAPRPGAPRPQEQAIPEAVKETLIGEQATEVTPIALSEAERALLQQTGTGETPTDIRAVIDRETAEFEENEKSVTNKILGVGGLNKSDGILDAEEEVERLKKEKIIEQ